MSRGRFPRGEVKNSRKRRERERVMHERKAEATEPLNETALPLQRMRMGDRSIEDTSDIRNAYAQGWRFSLSSSLAYLSPSFRFLFSHPLLSTSPSFHASFLPHSTDGFTRTLSLFLPLFLSFPIPYSSSIYSLIFRSLKWIFPIVVYDCLSLYRYSIGSNGTSDITDIFLKIYIHNFIHNHLV